jgi:hypothetical protein
MGKGGRPKNLLNNIRNIRYTVRFTDEENGKLCEIVSVLGWSVADYLRSKAFDGRKQVINGLALIANLDRVGGELGRAGNNINQLAKHANILNKSGKLDESIINRFNTLFADYIKSQQEMEVVIRKIIREAGG